MTTDPTNEPRATPKRRRKRGAADVVAEPHRGFLKYPGGKTQSVPRILSKIPRRVATYHEPFVGGGAAFFALAAETERRYARAVLSDVNPHVMNVYRAVRDDVGGLMLALDAYAQHLDSETYYRVRSAPEPTDSTLAAARRIYLNKLCYRGIHRENRDGWFNVPYGHYVAPKLYDRSIILAASAALQGVELAVSDFAEAIALAKRGDFVYGDPPYIPRSVTASFDDYSAGGFVIADHVRLAASLRDATDRGVMCLLSASDTELSRSVYVWTANAAGRPFAQPTVDVIGVQQAVNSHEKGQGSRRTTPELLIAYYDLPPSPSPAVIEGSSSR